MKITSQTISDCMRSTIKEALAKAMMYDIKLGGWTTCPRTICERIFIEKRQTLHSIEWRIKQIKCYENN